ncbi:unnamed protein product [Chironomus riparius]|uniref:C-type lectin domain-containing protein n=1 Tax=Chironomus riparius TaxID=315576 RepID=A0A9N9WV73_9DIPT|nr:unnamed protein product [Chironomus riparius]
MKTVFAYILFSFVVISSQAELPQQSNIVEKSVIVDNVAFIKIGTYRGTTDDGTEYQKSYFYPRYSPKISWFDSRSTCESFGFELTTLETYEEMQIVFNLADNYLKTLIDIGIFVDAMTLTLKSTTDWYWAKTGKKLSFALPWIPGEPNNSQNANEACLQFGKRTGSAVTGFNDVPCTSTAYTFLCQKIEFSIPLKIEETI